MKVTISSALKSPVTKPMTSDRCCSWVTEKHGHGNQAWHGIFNRFLSSFWRQPRIKTVEDHSFCCNHHKNVGVIRNLLDIHCVCGAIFVTESIEPFSYTGSHGYPFSSRLPFLYVYIYIPFSSSPWNLHSQHISRATQWHCHRKDSTDYGYEQTRCGLVWCQLSTRDCEGCSWRVCLYINLPITHTRPCRWQRLPQTCCGLVECQLRHWVRKGHSWRVSRNCSRRLHNRKVSEEASRVT